MNSRVSWSVEGIDPSVRERAEAAARRAGMSLNDWLNSTLGDSARPRFSQAPTISPRRCRARRRPTSPTSTSGWIRSPARSSRFRSPGRAAMCRAVMPRSDAPAQRRPARRTGRRPAIERRDLAPRRAAVADLQSGAATGPDAGQAAPGRDGRARGQPGVSPLAPAQPGVVRFRDRGNRRAPERTRCSRTPVDAAAQRAAQSSSSDGAAMAPAMPMAPPMQPAAPAGPDFSSLERHLLKITSQIEALQRPDGIEQSITAFRAELADIRAAITEAMPRRAIESIENEIRSLSRRIDDTRQSGTDGQALAGIERALSEIREVLFSLKPAEQLAGYDEAIRNLGGKLDLILRANDDPSTVQQLEGAISALRAIVSNVASNDALARLSDDVHMLSSKVDQLARSEGNSDSFASLEQRIAALTSTLESRERPASGDSTEHLEGALRSLSDRLDRMPVGNDNASAFAHLEQRVSYLLERIESFDRSPRRQSRPGRGRAAGHPAPSRKPACGRGRAGREQPQRQRAAAARQRRRRHRQARDVRHPLQPVGNRPPHPGFAGSRPLYARPCGRSARHDRRRPAHGARAARCAAAADAAGAATRSAAGGRAPRGDAAAAEARTAKSRRGP